MRDAGITLPELLIAVTITFTLTAAMAMATTVILRQADNSKGRLNNARSEQNVGLWMPADLASAEDVNTSANASPCGTGCPSNVTLGGSNALMLSWTGDVAGATAPVPTTTTVSYRYVQNATGEFEVQRIACVSVNGAASNCDTMVILHDVDPPPAGTAWVPGVTEPTWVMLVSLALDPSSVLQQELLRLLFGEQSFEEDGRGGPFRVHRRQQLRQVDGHPRLRQGVQGTHAERAAGRVAREDRAAGEDRGLDGGLQLAERQGGDERAHAVGKQVARHRRHLTPQTT
jgi:type II secretory pathway component PulJ